MTKTPTTILSSGWEDSGGTDVTDAGKWKGSVGSPTVVTSPVHHGTYALKCPGTRSGVYLIDQVVSDAFLRFQARRNTTPTASMNIGELWDSGYGYGVYAYVDTSNVLYLHAPSGNYSSGVTLSVDTWYCIKIERKVGSGNGLAKLWVNEVLKVERTTETITGNTFEIDVGTLSYTGTLTAYFDCVVFADAYIGTDAVAYTQTISDILGMVDSISKPAAFKRSVSEVLGMVDYSIAKGTFKKAVSDLLGLADAVGTKGTFKHSVADVLGMLDTATRSRGSPVTISEILGMRDRVETRKRLSKIGDLPDDTITGGA